MAKREEPKKQQNREIPADIARGGGEVPVGNSKRRLLHHSKVVSIFGVERGGTTLTWNILRSHPGLGAPGIELGWARLNRIARKMIQAPLFRRQPLNTVAGVWLDRRLFEQKMEMLKAPDSRYKAEGVLYTPEEYAGTDLCIKGVNHDVGFIPLLDAVYPQHYCIGLVRNGYAVCEGWVRRGLSARQAGRVYRECFESLIRQKMRGSKVMIVRFEDVLRDPFGAARKLFAFSRMNPVNLPKLRIKARPTLTRSGEYELKPGGKKRGRKYWCGPDEVDDFLVRDICEIQAEALDAKARNEFEEEAGHLLERFGYA